MARWHAVNWTRYHSLLHTLARMGHEVHVLQPPALESLETNFQEIKAIHHEGVFVHDVFIPGFLWNRRLFMDKLSKKAIYCIVATRVAKSMIASTPFDVLLLYNIPQLPLSKIRGPIQVFDYADDYIDMLAREMGSASNRPSLALARRLLEKMMRSADLVLSVSNELAHDGPVGMEILPNGVESAAFGGTEEAPPVCQKKNAQPVVGFIGSFEYFIDFDTILGAAQLCPDVRFLLVGTGRDFHAVRDKVQKMMLSNVQLTGGVPHEHVFGHIRSMDICLNIFKPLPVSHRACPIKLFEYLSQKKPVISTRLSELSHVDNGWLYYADTSMELVEKIRSILMNPREALEKACRAQNAVRERYTWEKIAQSFLDHVGEAMPRRANL